MTPAKKAKECAFDSNVANECRSSPAHGHITVPSPVARASRKRCLVDPPLWMCRMPHRDGSSNLQGAPLGFPRCLLDRRGAALSNLIAMKLGVLSRCGTGRITHRSHAQLTSLGYVPFAILLREREYFPLLCLCHADPNPIKRTCKLGCKVTRKYRSCLLFSTSASCVQAGERRLRSHRSESSDRLR